MGRKITTILGRTDEFASMKGKLENTHFMMHYVDQRTSHTKTTVGDTLHGLDEVLELNKEILREVKEQNRVLREIVVFKIAITATRTKWNIG